MTCTDRGLPRVSFRSLGCAPRRRRWAERLPERYLRWLFRVRHLETPVLQRALRARDRIARAPEGCAVHQFDADATARAAADEVGRRPRPQPHPLRSGARPARHRPHDRDLRRAPAGGVAGARARAVRAGMGGRRARGRAAAAHRAAGAPRPPAAGEGHRGGALPAADVGGRRGLGRARTGLRDRLLAAAPGPPARRARTAAGTRRAPTSRRPTTASSPISPRRRGRTRAPRPPTGCGPRRSGRSSSSTSRSTSSTPGSTVTIRSGRRARRTTPTRRIWRRSTSPRRSRPGSSPATSCATRCARSRCTRPWVRHVYVVTDRQVPPWLNVEHPQLTVVDHREIFRDPSVLPVFNSHAIESQLHHIPGLSEHYLYLNDDFFFGRPVQPELFFHANGIAKFFLSAVVLDVDPPSRRDLPVLSAAKQNRAAHREGVRRHHHAEAQAHAATPDTQRGAGDGAPSSRRVRGRGAFALPAPRRPVHPVRAGALLRLRAGQGGAGRHRLPLPGRGLPGHRSAASSSCCAAATSTSSVSTTPTARPPRRRTSWRCSATFLDRYYPHASRFERA